MKKILLVIASLLSMGNVSAMDTDALSNRLIKERNYILSLANFCSSNKPYQFKRKEEFKSCFPDDSIKKSQLKNFRQAQQTISQALYSPSHKGNEFTVFVTQIYDILLCGLDRQYFTGETITKIEEWSNECHSMIKDVACKLFNVLKYNLFTKIDSPHTKELITFLENKKNAEVRIVEKNRQKRSMDLPRTNGPILQFQFDYLKNFINSAKRDSYFEEIISLLDKDILYTIALGGDAMEFNPKYNSIRINKIIGRMPRYSPLPLKNVTADSTGWYPFLSPLKDTTMKRAVMHELGHAVYVSILTILENMGDSTTYESILNSTLKFAAHFLEDGARFTILNDAQSRILDINRKQPLNIMEEVVPPKEAVKFLTDRSSNKEYIMRLLFSANLEEIFQILGFIVIGNRIYINPYNDIANAVHEKQPFWFDHGLIPECSIAFSKVDNDHFLLFCKESPKELLSFSGLRLNEKATRTYFNVLNLNYDEYKAQLANF